MNLFGSQSEVGKIRKVLLKSPASAFIDSGTIDQHWNEYNYPSAPDYSEAMNEYDSFVKILKDHGIEIDFLPEHKNTGLDSIYTHDPVIITNNGAILCNMGKVLREGEPDAAGEELEKIGVPIQGRITGEGRIEGGDVVWLNERLVAVAEGYRSNSEGIRQFEALLGDSVDQVIAVPLPHWDGPDDVLHIMSMISPIDEDLAVVYSRLMAVPFREKLLELGFTLIEVSDDEYLTMACNVLALEPGVCLMLEGNPKTKSRIEEHGCKVITYKGDEISRKGAGGPTCLTRPIYREYH